MDIKTVVCTLYTRGEDPHFKGVKAMSSVMQERQQACASLKYNRNTKIMSRAGRQALREKKNGVCNCCKVTNAHMYSFV